jgi:L-glutamine-phosphate cytidylyltransferase
MKAIIIGAGRGKRLRHFTEEIPKPLVPILGRPMLDGVLEAIELAGLSDTVFICGYLGEVIRARYPELGYIENADWQNNNILFSLLCAREHLHEGFVSSYADIVYRPEAMKAAVESPHDITLVCDTAWRRRYEARSEHPETDAEKVRGEGDLLVEISRTIEPARASGEFIGVMKMTPAGVKQFLAAFDDARGRYADDEAFVEGRTFKKAYLIDLLQRMQQAGTPIHAAWVDGGYMEIDTTEDAAMADAWWAMR